MVRAVRGAIQIDANDPESIRSGVVDLVGELVRRNHVVAERIVSIIFSQTDDLTALNPATALRSDEALGFGAYRDVPLFCTQEPRYDTAMPRMIRVLLTFSADAAAPLVPVYLNGAELLRADLFGDEDRRSGGA